MAAGERHRVLPISAPQADVLASDAAVTGYVGGRGSGKTWIGGYRIASRALPGDPWLCVSPDAGVVHDTTLPTFLDITQSLGVYRRHVLTPYPRVWWETSAGPGHELAQMVFRSGEAPDKLRGPNKAGLWIDEASIQTEDVFLIARATLRYKGRMGPTLLTMTPRGRNHWTFGVFFERASDEHEPGVELIQGVPYHRKGESNLIQASTRQNPFLPDEFYDSMAGSYSSVLAAQELEGEFVDVEGLMFRREWFEVIDRPPRTAMRVRYWDRAASVTSHSSYSAGVLIARDDRGMYYIEDVIRGQWSAHDRDNVIYQVAVSDAQKYQNEVLIYAEQEGGSGGKEVMQQLIKKLAGFPIFRDLASGSGTRRSGGVILPGGAKVTRAQPLAAQAQAGNVKLIGGSWNSDFLSEITAFPESAHADQVDAAAAGLNRLAALAQPDEVIAEKERIAVHSQRFGQAVGTAESNRRRGSRSLFGRQ